MSAINDALRRASSAAKTPSQPPGATLPPMNVTAKPPWTDPVPAAGPVSSNAESVTPPPIIAPPLHSAPLSPLDDQPPKKSSKLPLILVLLFVLCIGGFGALYFFGKGRLIANAREKLRVHEEGVADRGHVAAPFGGTGISTQSASAAARRDVQIASATTTQSHPATATVTSQPVPKPAPAPLATPIVTAKPVPAPAPVPPVRFPPLRLQSIFYRPGNASVMINGKTLFIGDEIGGVSIADIQPSSVTLVLSGQTNILTLR